LPQRKESSPLIVIFLLSAILAIFVLQIPLQKVEIKAEIPRGADVAVIGGMTAALLSAMEAAENGVQVFLFPNGQDPGEDSSFLVTGGLAAALTPPQQELEAEYTLESFAEKIKENGGGLSDPALLDAFIISVPDLYQELKEISGLYFDTLPQPDAKPFLHFSSQPDAALQFKDNLLEGLKNSTVTVSEDKVKELIFSPRGQLEALMLESADDGETYRFYIQAAVLADGGYSGVAHYWHQYLPDDNLVNLRPAQKGEGLQMAEALGLDLVQMGFLNAQLLCYAPLGDSYLPLPAEPWDDTSFINTAGQFLSWEESSYREAVAFVLNSPSGGPFLMAPEEPPAPFDRFFRHFDDLEGLMQAYSFASTPAFPGLRPPVPDYYVSPLRIGIDYTLGGIAVTPRAEVKKEGNIVPGMYAAGEIVGGLHGEALLPGMALSETLFLAETAGEAAAEYARR
jgi:succinate dehydrogenase/fumarate reductase flavoprotein subunit